MYEKYLDHTGKLSDFIKNVINKLKKTDSLIWVKMNIHCSFNILYLHVCIYLFNEINLSRSLSKNNNLVKY